MDATTSDQCPDIRDPHGERAQSFDERRKLQINGSKSHRRDKRRVVGELGAQPHPCSSSSSSSSTMCAQNSLQRGFRIANKRRNPRFLGRHRASDMEAIAFPLGMSIAAVVAQVLERTDANWEKMPVDRLSMICTSAVRESLANVFGDKFEPFARNFEKAFGSTLNTLRLVKGSSGVDKGSSGVDNLQDHLNHLRLDNNPKMTPAARECSSRNFDGNDCQRESRNFVRNDCQKESRDYDGNDYQKDLRSFDANDCPMESILPTVVAQEESNNVEEILVQENQPTVTVARELSLHGIMHRELSCVSSNMRSCSRNNSMVGTIEKSIAEQARANDLKAFEIGLVMKKLQLKEAQLALSSDSNFLERCKLSMGVSKASFKAEKFKTQLEDTRHAELLRNCIDCLVAGLLIMSSLIIYGSYVYSYKRIIEATSACTPSMESNSWWIPKPVASFNSGLQTLRCQVQVISRMLFGIIMILAIGYLIFQRAATPRQTMPVTSILLLLSVGCGIVGKFCIDTLGGSGYHWLLYWEVLCLLHFFANMFTPFFFVILYGPIKVSQGAKGSVILPYWIRRVVFYLVILLLLPTLSGLIPFAGLGEWKDHFSSLISNLLLVAEDLD